jgi:RNA polymerase primary sigma factor
MDFNENSMNPYFKMISRYPLLKHEEIIELFKQFEAAKSVKNTRLQKQLKDKIVNHNLRFVIYIAKRYSKRHPTLDFEDLIMWGNIGLMKAVDKFDWHKGNAFSTYASFWVKSHMDKLIIEEGIIYLPHLVKDLLTRKKQFTDYFISEYNRIPSTTEIAEYLGVDQKKMDFIRDAEMKSASNISSLDSPVGEDGGTLIDVIEDSSSSLVAAKKLNTDEITELITKLLERFGKRERAIFMLRSGLNGEKKMTLSEVGKKYHLSRERIRQIQAKVTKELRKVPELRRIMYNDESIS